MNSSRRNIQAILAATAVSLFMCAPGAMAQNYSKAFLARTTGKLDTKSAKVGDTLTAQTLTKSQLNNGSEIPKGAKIIATVTEVQSKEQGGGSSTLTLRFDKVQVKGQAPITVHAALVAVAPPPEASGDLPLGSTSSRGGSLTTQNGYGHSDNGDMEIPMGSTIDGVGLGDHIGADGTAQLRGDHRDIKLDRDALIKIAFF